MKEDEKNTVAVITKAESLITDSPDSAIALINSIAKNYTFEQEPPSAVKAYKIAALANNNMGKFQNTIINLKNAYRIAEKHLQDKEMYEIADQIANTYFKLENFEKALIYFQKNFKNNYVTSDKKLKALCYFHAGQCYYKLNKFNQALEYYEKARQTYQFLWDKINTAKIYEEMGNIYLDWNKSNIALLQFQKALFLRKEANIPELTSQSYYCLGQTFFMLKDPNSCQLYLDSAISALGSDIKERPKIKLLYAKCEYQKGNKANAIQELIYCIELAQQTGNNLVAIHAYEQLSQIYEETKQFDKAHDSYKMYQSLKEIYDQTNGIVSMIEKNFEIENYEKDNQIKTAALEKNEAEITRKKIIINAVVGGLALLLILLVVLYRWFLLKRKSNQILSFQRDEIMQKNEELLQQKEEIIAHRNEIEDQKRLIEVKNKDITDSIVYASRIQKAILPTREKMNLLIGDNMVFYLPKDIISGDFYWTEKVGNKTLVAAVDCTGHGVPGALMSIICFDCLNSSINEFGLTQPGAILDKVNELLAATLHQSDLDDEIQDGMDIALFSIDADNMMLEYAGAKNSLLLVRNNQEIILENATKRFHKKDFYLYEYKADRLSIGAHHHKKYYNNTTIKILKGDILYIFSDGYIDQVGGNTHGDQGKKFMSNRFRELLADIAHLPLEKQKEALEKNFHEWKGFRNQYDDVLILAVKI